MDIQKIIKILALLISLVALYFLVNIMALGALISAGHWVTDSVSRTLRDLDVYEPQYNVLRILRAAGLKPLSVNEILDQMVQKSSNVTRIVDKLAAKGLVERKLSKLDRRRMEITITNSGAELLVELDQRVHGFHEPYINNLNAEEAMRLRHLIEKLRDTGSEIKQISEIKSRFWQSQLIKIAKI